MREDRCVIFASGSVFYYVRYFRALYLVEDDFYYVSLYVMVQIEVLDVIISTTYVPRVGRYAEVVMIASPSIAYSLRIAVLSILGRCVPILIIRIGDCTGFFLPRILRYFDSLFIFIVYIMRVFGYQRTFTI